ncbi:glycosyltransferase family 9 protein [Pseudonocardia sp. S2-4]|uniref:Glycosyltransferase family 9 protein n=1 Tax=Pseudonocardia humida TaxID=2800819 RepID=A0ABT0ZV70_9PSEU|nr:glycosyltransferase family 9 protein [Pseudonocardia humida]
MALVLRALGLGDLLVAVPALRGLRKARPEHRIVLATPAPLVGLAELTGAVDEVLPTAAPHELRPTWDGPPDLAVNLHGAGPQSHHALDALRPRARIGFGGPPGWDGPTHAQVSAGHPHERELWCTMLAHHGIPADPLDLRLDPQARAAPAVVVHPGAAFGAKRWPAERFAAVAAALEGPVPVVVTGSAEERESAQRVAGAAGLPAERVLAGRTSIRELCDVVAGAALVVSGDTGIAHLAAAFGTPSVVLFGPAEPRRWGPPPGPHRVLTAPQLRRGDPFADDPDPALLAVGVEEVLDAAARVRR